MELNWQRRLRRRDGEARKSVRQWSIPKKLRETYLLLDGTRVNMRATCPIFSRSLNVLLTSGGEFRLDRETADALLRYSLLQSDAEVHFAFDLAEIVYVVSEIEEDLRGRAKKALAPGPGAHESLDAEVFGSDRPASKVAHIRVFERDPKVIATVLLRARGACEVCRKEAPFLRAADGQAYLEVHHVQWLARGGKDRVDNALALCPNCHREAHHGNQLHWSSKLPGHLQVLALSTR